MREEAEINGRCDYFLNGEELIVIEFLTGHESIAGSIEELDDPAVSHEGEFAGVRLHDCGQKLLESLVVFRDLLALGHVPTSPRGLMMIHQPHDAPLRTAVIKKGSFGQAGIESAVYPM
jgi:hypothetical protein